MLLAASSHHPLIEAIRPQLARHFLRLDVGFLAASAEGPRPDGPNPQDAAKQATVIVIVEPTARSDPDGRYGREVTRFFAGLGAAGREKCHACTLEQVETASGATRIGPRGRSLGDLRDPATLVQLADLDADPPRLCRVGTGNAAPKDVPLLSDRPAESDLMGFTHTIDALTSFLSAESLQPPLVVSVEGGWGVGKSSFLLQLRQALRLEGWKQERRKQRTRAREDKADADEERSRSTDPAGIRTVWFNAWSSDSATSAYSSFALALIAELGRHNPFNIAWYRVHLAYRRFDWRTGWRDAARLLGGLMMLVAAVAVACWGVPAGLHAPLARGVNAVEAGQIAILGILGLQGVRQLWSFFGSPFAVDIRQHVKAPDYEGKKSLGDLHFQDIGKIIDVYSGKAGRIVVFIDDLDRCEPGKVADVTQAISVILANAGKKLIYVLAIDRDKVAAAIAAKNKDIATIAGPTGAKASQPIDFGHVFLEKLIQVPVRIPSGSIDSLKNWIDTINLPAPALPPEAGTMAQVVSLAAPFLRANPRRVKQFVNLLRLRVRLLETSRTDEKLPTLFQLGKLTIVELLFPAFIQDLSAEPTLLQTLLLGAGDGLESESYRRWSAHSELIEILLTSASVPAGESSSASARRDRHTSLLDVEVGPVLRWSTRTRPAKRPRSGAVAADLATKNVDELAPASLYDSMARYAQEYEAIRRREPYSDDRTVKLDRLFADMATIRGLPPEQTRKMFATGGAGLRIAALASCLAERATWAVPILVEVFRRSLTAFEEYQALRVALSLWQIFADVDQRALARAVSERVLTNIRPNDTPIKVMLGELARLADAVPLVDEIRVVFPDHRSLRLALANVPTFNDLTNRAYLPIQHDNRPNYYGTDWRLVLGDEPLRHRRELDRLGPGSPVQDERPLQALGISSGAELRAIKLAPTDLAS